MLVSSVNGKQLSQSKNHLFALDGFRAALAMWVFLGHLADTCGYSNKLLALHPLAVDLFMILSGFLMVHTWKQEIRNTNFFSKSTINFYIMRFFRIAPLYYLLLLACYLFGPVLAHMHDVILKEMPPPWAQSISNYEPHTNWGFEGFRWIWMHLTFLFGLTPGMENSTPLPDWSLSLEMQFYFVFPLLLVITRKIPLIITAIIVAAIAAVSPKLFGNYLDAGIWSHFGQPSFLPYRLNAFFAGMLVALWLKSNAGSKQKNITKQLLIGCAAIISVLPLSKPVILLYLLFTAICYKKIPYLSKLLSLKVMRHLGNISYSVYLCHILIVYPVVYLLIERTVFITLLPIERFIFAVSATLPLVIIFSYFLYRYVEIPSIKFGKKLSTPAPCPL